MLNKVFLMGRLTRDPEFRQTTSGVAVCRFSVAIDRKFANKESGEREADFVDCEAWRNTAEFISRFFQKGNMILVEGQLRNNNYTDNNGVKHYGMKTLVDSVSFCGSKSESGGGNAPQTNAGYQNAAPAAPAPPQAQTAPTAAPPSQGSLSIGDLGDLGEFEEILGGEPPF